MKIHFECKECGREFECDVGDVVWPRGANRPAFESKVVCPRCGEKTIDDVRLTELGQTELTAATLGSTPVFLWEEVPGTGEPSWRAEEQDEEEFGLYDGFCQACDLATRVDDMSLCAECAGKLERDFIRLREWDYSASCFGLPVDRREVLRKEIVKKFGKELELIDAPADRPSRKRSRRAVRRSRPRKRKGGK